MSLLVPMIAGMGDPPIVENLPQGGSLIDEVARDLEITERLIYLKGASVSDVRRMLVNAQNYLLRVPVYDGWFDSEKDARDESLAELEQQIAKLANYDQTLPDPEEWWPDQRRAIERAYQWAERNGSKIDLAAGDGDGDYFGAGIERTAQQAIKWLAIGLLVYGGVLVLPGLLAGLAAKKGPR